MRLDLAYRRFIAIGDWKWTWSSQAIPLAARGTASRRGLGKLRHVQTRYLWIQERVAKNELKIIAVGTKQNVADLCTKPVNKDTCEKHMKTLGQIFATGKASGAKALES